MAEKTRKSPKVRTDAQLLGMGEHGKVFLVIRKAFALAKKNNFSDTVRASKKYPAGVLYSKGKDGGSYWKLAADSKEFKDLKAAAKSALSELKKDTPQYGKGVKDLVNAFSGIGGGRGSALNMSSLQDLSL